MQSKPAVLAYPNSNNLGDFIHEEPFPNSDVFEPS